MSEARRIRDNNKGVSKTVLINADLIEGVHHQTVQLKVPMVSDMVVVAFSVIDDFLNNLGFSVKNGDKLYFTTGTESHTGYSEADIVANFSHLGAELHDELRINNNGVDIWMTHQWASVGKGHNEGNALFNALKVLYYDCLKENIKMPDITIGSHFHKAGLGSFSQHFKTYYGLITPSLQMKTRYAQKVTSFQRNDVGFLEFDISANGGIKFQPPVLLDVLQRMR